MVTVDVRGVQVMFPFPPYECQLAYMEKVIEAIDMKFDAALESPTGTGKTLSLLCSTLGWLQKQKMMFQMSFEDATRIASGSAPTLSSFLPRIYYCSRTHSQLSQVVRELNRTMYKDIRTTVLGSRDQLCIHEKVTKERDSRVKTAMCRSMVSRRTCHYYNNWDKTPRDMLDNLFTESGNVPDIEDMVTIGEKHRICPFFRCRQMQETSELILLPYNYIIDPQLRKIHKIDLNGSIIIFDEAHNLESICEEVVSVEISSVNISLAITELKEAIQCLQQETEELRNELDNSSQAFGGGTAESEKLKGPPFQVGDAAVLLSMLFELEVKVEATFNDKSGRNLEGFSGKVFPGDRLLETFEGAGFSYDKADAVSKLLSDITDYLQRETDVKPASAERGKNLELLRSFISVVYLSLSKEAALAITKEKVNAGALKTENITIDPKRVGRHFKLYIVKEDETADKPACTVMKFWCFSSSIAMRALKMNGVRSVIVTSGTLSPLANFTRNIGLDFGSTLENKHAAKGDQVIAGLIGRSPCTECVMNGSFAKRNDKQYAVGIAESILSLASSVPQGILVFFASYSLMNNLISKFKQLPCKVGLAKTFWDSMVEEKVVVVEPKQKNLLGKVRSEFTQGVRSGRGAMFFAVCRGKVSEGIDFSDADSRAVCVVGIPYPPMMDVRICLKRLYINEMAAEDKTAQSADEWYVTEGYRAVNQAVGRVIRHVNDFGVVALLDERFANVKKDYFPAWIRSSVKVFDKGSEFIAATQKFFSDRKLEVKKSSIPLMRLDDKLGNLNSGTLPRKRSNIVLSAEVTHECVMDYGLYSGKPPCKTNKDENLRVPDKSSLLSICTAEESSKSVKSVPSVETFDASLESEPPSTSQAIPPPIRKKLKLTVSYSSSIFGKKFNDVLWYMIFAIGAYCKY
nr:DEAD2 domain containing protein [Haemonchus contortus]